MTNLTAMTDALAKLLHDCDMGRDASYITAAAFIATHIAPAIDEAVQVERKACRYVCFTARPTVAAVGRASDGTWWQTGVRDCALSITAAIRARK